MENFDFRSQLPLSDLTSRSPSEAEERDIHIEAEESAINDVIYPSNEIQNEMKECNKGRIEECMNEMENYVFRSHL